MTSPNLQARLTALRAQYAAGLPAEVRGARKALERLSEDGAAAIEACWQRVHRIYGTAGSYGLHEVARLASLIETELGPYRESGAPPRRVMSQVEATLAELEAQASETART